MGAERARHRVAVCSSVHAEWDPRIVYREGAALAREFDVHLYVNDTGRPAPRGFSDTPFGVTRFPTPSGRLRRALSGRRIVRQALQDGAEAVIVHDPEMLPWLIWIAKRRGVVTVYDVHEDYPSMVRTKHWLPAWLRPVASAIIGIAEKGFARRADVVMVADSRLELEFAAEKPVLVRNYPPRGIFAQSPEAGSRLPLVVYAGGVTGERGATLMVEAMRMVRERVPGAELLVIGRVPHGDAADLIGSEEGVTLLPETSYPALAEHLAAARVGLALLQDTPKHRSNVPSKLFDYMACGTPFVATDLPNIREATGEAGGLFVAAGDVKAASSTIIRLLEDDELADRLGREGVSAVVERFSFEAEAAALITRLREHLE